MFCFVFDGKLSYIRAYLYAKRNYMNILQDSKAPHIKCMNISYVFSI